MDSEPIVLPASPIGPRLHVELMVPRVSALPEEVNPCAKTIIDVTTFDRRWRSDVVDRHPVIAPRQNRSATALRLGLSRREGVGLLIWKVLVCPIYCRV